MTGIDEAKGPERSRAAHPAAQAAGVFVLAALLSALIPNGWIERVGAGSGWPGLEPPVGYGGRTYLALLVGSLAAFLYAAARWWREGERDRAEGRPLAVADDRLKVEPIAAQRDLGASFDESPYLAPPPPPTPDARLDPESTLAEPRWQVSEPAGELPVAPVEVEPVERDWRIVPPAGEAEAEGERAERVPLGDAPDEDAPQGEAGSVAPADDRPPEWDGIDRRAEDGAAWSGPERRVRPIWPARDEVAEDAPGELPSTTELLERLMRAVDRHEADGTRPATPRPAGGPAAELAAALKALKGE